MTYTVIAEGLCRSFAGRTVLDQVDLAVPQGSVAALLGPNGAGKTTLVRILATLLQPDAGSATVAGHDLRTDPQGVRRATSLTGQHVAVDDVLTGRENLEMVARLRHLPRRAVAPRVRELLDDLDLAEAADRRVSTYSGGMRRRLDLAASMVQRPEVLFLDEPTTGLDPRSRAQLWRTLRGLLDLGITVLLTTQYLEEADALADSVTLVDRGKVVARGTPEELKSGVGTDVVALEFAAEADYRRALERLGVLRRDDRLRVVEVPTDGSAAAVLALLRGLEESGLPAARAWTHRPSLDDVFLSLTGPGEPVEVLR